MLATRWLRRGSGCAGCVTFEGGSPGSAGRGVPAGERFPQVVPLARTAHLDHVAAGVRIRRGHPHPRVDGPDPAVLLLQPIAVDIGEQYELIFLADRAVAAGRLTHVLRGPHELGVGIAELVDRLEARLRVAQERALGERVVDHVQLGPLGATERGTWRSWLVRRLPLHRPAMVPPGSDEWIRRRSSVARGPGRHEG